jgi:hypothetical protein
MDIFNFIFPISTSNPSLCFPYLGLLNYEKVSKRFSRKLICFWIIRIRSIIWHMIFVNINRSNFYNTFIYKKDLCCVSFENFSTKLAKKIFFSSLSQPNQLYTILYSILFPGEDTHTYSLTRHKQRVKILKRR